MRKIVEIFLKTRYRWFLVIFSITILNVGQYCMSPLTNMLCLKTVSTVCFGHHSCTPSDRIYKVVASHAAVARSVPAEVALIYNMHEALRGYCP